MVMDDVAVERYSVVAFSPEIRVNSEGGTNVRIRPRRLQREQLQVMVEERSAFT